MILRGEPNKIITKRFRNNGKTETRKWFQFNSDGLVFINEGNIDIRELSTFIRKYQLLDYKDVSFEKLKKVCQDSNFKVSKYSKEKIIYFLENEVGYVSF